MWLVLEECPSQWTTSTALSFFTITVSAEYVHASKMTQIVSILFSSLFEWWLSKYGKCKFFGQTVKNNRTQQNAGNRSACVHSHKLLINRRKASVGPAAAPVRRVSLDVRMGNRLSPQKATTLSDFVFPMNELSSQIWHSSRSLEHKSRKKPPRKA